MDTHYSETFKVFKQVVPFLVENQKTFVAICRKRVSTDHFSIIPSCPECVRRIESERIMMEKLAEVMERFAAGRYVNPEGGGTNGKIGQ